MIALTVIGWLAATLAGLLVLVLVVPVHLRLKAAAEAGLHLSLEARLVSGEAPRLFRIETGGAERARPKAAGASPRPAPSGKPGRRDRSGKGGGRGWTRRLIAGAPDTVIEILGAVRIDRLRAEGWFGLADPADTGQLWGRLAPIVYTVRGPVELDLWPSFDRVGLGGAAEARLHFTFLRLIAPAVRLFVRVAPWRS